MQNSVHFVGICGVTMAPLAVLYKDMGWRVTGSDRAFFPPMSTYLKKNGIEIMPGFKTERILAKPDFLLISAFITEKNPEVAEAKRLGIPIKVYADVLPELIEKENSIIIAGDCGKTSTTALMAWILDVAGYSPSFMIGGLANNFNHGIRRTDTIWSVIEADEYPISSWDNTPRFLSYSPKYLILTDIRWDHMDKFATEKEYIDIFKKLTARIPKDGVIVANSQGENIQEALDATSARVVFYSDEDVKNFVLPFGGQVWRQNCAATIALGRELGIGSEDLQKGLISFTGVKRRQEVRFEGNNTVIVDDNAHTPVKVAGGLEAISQMLPGYDLCVIYEPGNRSDSALDIAGYNECFNLAQKIILPKISTANEASSDFNKRLHEKIVSNYKNCVYLNDDKEVLKDITEFARDCKNSNKKAGVVFMSQKGFRGMIEEIISLLQ